MHAKCLTTTNEATICTPVYGYEIVGQLISMFCFAVMELKMVQRMWALFVKSWLRPDES